MNKERRRQINIVIAKISALSAAINAITDSDISIDDLIDEVQGIREDEEEYKDNMPESLQNGDKGQMADESISNLEDAKDNLEEFKCCFCYLVENHLSPAVDFLESAK